MNSRVKGKVGEREFAALLREHGFDARRGQQFHGGAESPDVVSDALAWLHVEVKRVQRLNLMDACAQAQGDCAGKPWIVAHRRNHAPWLITMTAEFFFRLLREFQPRMDTDEHGFLPQRHGDTEQRQGVGIQDSADGRGELRRDAAIDPRDAGATHEFFGGGEFRSQ
jgi:hypothetical protein